MTETAVAGGDGRTHRFHAVAFVETFALGELSAGLTGAQRTPRDVRSALPSGGAMWVYPFGAAVFQDASAEARRAELERLSLARPGRPTTQILSEEFAVHEDPRRRPDVVEGTLVLDRLTPERASTVALTMAQSAAMEYYEGLVERMFGRTAALVARLRGQGGIPLRIRALHQFIGQAVVTRNEVLSVLHLLDKPDETWDDPVMDRIYDELRAQFDLVDRHEALELKLRAIQESLELVLDVARDRRVFLLEVTVVLLIALEIVLSLIRAH